MRANFGRLVDAMSCDRAMALGVVWRLIARGALKVDLAAPIQSISSEIDMSGAASRPDLAEVPVADWHKARRRFEVISVLAKAPERTRSDAEAAAQSLGCSATVIYRLLLRYLADPRVTSLLPGRRGRRHGQLFWLEMSMR